MSLNYCKVELKFKWARYCVLSAAGADDNNANSSNIFVYYQRQKIVCSYCNFTINS